MFSLLVVIPPTGSARPSAPTSAGGNSPTLISAAVTFGGSVIDSATAPANALSSNFANVVPVDFIWSARGGRLGTPALVEITAARLQMIYLGQPVLTREVDVSNAQLAPGGQINMSGDFRDTAYLIEGLLSFNALLIASNGTTVWSQQFYVQDHATDHLTVINILLVGLILYEAYSLVGIARRPPAPAPPMA
ncbi:MAG: hypothetical protein L3K09_08050, partial [Thermoplasmata archaeon]|nr:hypothetical protein [Thermoplasmata archaeon]